MVYLWQVVAAVITGLTCFQLGSWFERRDMKTRYKYSWHCPENCTFVVKTNNERDLIAIKNHHLTVSHDFIG